MLEWLSIWLREIILVILLAAFVDLLLPGRAMQRYVKVVVSLFILMTILSPLILLIKTDFDFSNLSWSTAAQGEIHQAPGMASGIKPLAAVLDEGRRLQTMQQQQTQSIIEDRLAEEMRLQLEPMDRVHVESLTVHTRFDEDAGYSIDQVLVSLRHWQDADLAGEDSRETDRSSGIEPVQQVYISIDVSAQERHDTRPVAANQIAESVTSEFEDRIKRHLSEAWQLQYSQIDVSYVEE